jgi:hypothetical protein
MAIGYGTACPKPAPRIIERKAKVTAEAKAEKAAKDLMWRRAKSRCEYCGRAVKRGSVDSLQAGHAHHDPPRSKGDKSTMWSSARLRLACAFCDADHGKLLKAGRA